MRGARQVGKSYTIKAFGIKEFDNLVTVNFEQNPNFKECFTSLEPKDIIENIAILCKKDITTGNTLLFLDEIQDCPNAILSLRYFYEQMPDLHVIGAGSLLDFVIASEDFRMPVGRIQYLFMKPVSFIEFLDTLGEDKARQYIETKLMDAAPNNAIHERLLSLVKKYMILGGMPAVLNEYLSTGNLAKCSRIQSSIAQTYIDDFGKYANIVKHKYLQKIFYSVPKMLGNKFKYSHVDPNIKSRDLKDAVDLLEKAGVIYRVKRTSGEGLPLEAQSNDRHFKLVFMDIGLAQNMLGLSEEMLLAKDAMSINSGAIAEQFTAQELLAYYDNYKAPALYYWAREERNSAAEIDYLIQVQSSAVPIEVKAGKTGALRSMWLFYEKYKPIMGVKISQSNINLDPPVISLPLYSIELLFSKKFTENISKPNL